MLVFAWQGTRPPANKKNKVQYPEDVMLRTAASNQEKPARKATTPQHLKGLIVKCRWAGMEQDAEKLCHELETVAPQDCPPRDPLETD